MKKFRDPPRGVNNNQWYSKDPKRIKEEVALMKKFFPDFKQGYEENGDVFWKGTVKIEKINSSLNYDPHYKNFKIKILCKETYPISFPFVIDEDKLLLGKSPHLYTDKNAICYSFGTATELDFENKHRIKDLYGVIQEYLVKQSVFEDTKIWPDAQPHANQAFILAEFENGCLSPDTICPCRLHGKKYKDCHLADVEKTIGIINSSLRNIFGKRKLGRNDRCPCGSGKKYKFCCLWKNYFGAERKHFIQLYPQLSKDVLLVRLARIDKVIEQQLLKNK